ncbi:Vhs2p [Nakaseomyces bracarensis]|uniref:Vhs2p n=1 Tax=Nakaseomyces bracarensis TaxID=273131 RepID=UPI0038725AC4
MSTNIEERSRKSSYNNSPSPSVDMGSPLIFERNVEDPYLMNSTSTISRQTSNTSLLNPRKYSSTTGLNLQHTYSASSQKPNSPTNNNNNNNDNNTEEFGFPNISHSSTNLSSVDGSVVEQEVIYQNPINHRRTLENFVPPALDEGCSIVTDEATDLEDVDMVFVHSRKPSTIGLDMALGRTRSMSTLKPGSIIEGLETTSSANSDHSTSPKLFRFYSYADMLSEDNYTNNSSSNSNQLPKRPSFSHHSLSANLLQKSKTLGQTTTAQSASNLIGSSPPKSTTQGFVNPFIVSRRYSSNTGPIQTAAVSPPPAAGLPAGSRSQSNLLRQGSYSTLSPNTTPLSFNNTTSAGNSGNNNNGGNKPDRFMRTSQQRPTIFRNYSAGGELNEVGSPTSPTLSLSTSPRISSNNRSMTSPPPPLTSTIMIKSGRSNSANVNSSGVPKSPQSPPMGYHIRAPGGRRQVDNVNKTLTKFHIESSGSEDYSTDEDYDGDNDYVSRGGSKKNSVDSNVIDDDESENGDLVQINEDSKNDDNDEPMDPSSEDTSPNGMSFFSPHIKIPKNKLQKNLMSSFEKFQNAKIWRNGDNHKRSLDVTDDPKNKNNETPVTSKSNSFLGPSTNSNSLTTITDAAGVAASMDDEQKGFTNESKSLETR